MDGLFKYKARYDGSIPIVTTPDGVEYRGNSEDVDEVLSKWLGFPVRLAREESISHFDGGPVSIIKTSSLRMLSKQLVELWILDVFEQTY
ncbi:MAG: hypothetical protein K0Q73_2263 [Paenibacillus sp.]|jgi:hypothetical protein|nr:hypothetical protein [Paenibacillus sp.]